MKKLLLLLLMTLSIKAKAQRVVLDRNHLAIVIENNAARLSAELAHQNRLEGLNSRLKQIQLNLDGVILTEALIYSSLSQLDQGMKSLSALTQIGGLSLEIITEAKSVISSASSSPALLLFAQQSCNQLATRGVSLASEVNTIILKEGQNLLMDYEKRDALLKKISLELKTIRALLYSINKCMYWAKINGVFRSANPFRGFINTDKRMVENLLLNYKTLKN